MPANLTPDYYAAERDGSAFLLTGEHTTARLDPVAPDGATSSFELVPGGDRHGGGDFAMPTVRLTKTGSRWQAATVITWAPLGTAPASA